MFRDKIQGRYIKQQKVSRRKALFPGTWCSSHPPQRDTHLPVTLTLYVTACPNQYILSKLEATSYLPAEKKKRFGVAFQSLTNLGPCCEQFPPRSKVNVRIILYTQP